jgi:prolyl 4-hydroxylase
MSEQKITPELKQWIVDQVKAQKTHEQVLNGMLASGWTEEMALVALEQTLSGFLQNHAQANGLPEVVVVPDPYLANTPTSIAVEGHTVNVLISMRNPRVIVFGNMLSSSECEELIALARPRLGSSQTVIESTGAPEVIKERTSEGMFFEREENALCARIESRIAKLTNWPIENSEGLQVLHYQVGAEYKPHYDYFEHNQSGTPALIKKGGQRVASLIMYLNTPTLGGTTVFPDIQLDIAPIQGNAVFFSYDRPHPMTRTLHAGAPLIEGEKWVVTKWLRERAY